MKSAAYTEKIKQMTIQNLEDKKKRTAEYFWSRVNIKSKNECWPWIWGLSMYGYGKCSTCVYGTNQAHRVAWMYSKGPIPKGMDVLHKCDNPPCCNPKHLFLGTNTENQMDKYLKGRQCKGETIGNSKLTQRQVDQIRDLYMEGYLQREIAVMFGVQRPHISRLINHVRWK